MDLPDRIFTTPVFVYDDGVEYLQDWASHAKRLGITQKEFIAQAGIDSHSLFSDVINRRKPIGKKHLESFIKALKLVGDEAEYFRLLETRNIIKDPEKRKEIFKQLADLREKNMKAVLEEKNLEYFASWKYPVIREFILTQKDPVSAKDIAKSLVNLKLGTREIEFALAKLEKWGMVKYDSQSNGWMYILKEDLSYSKIPHVYLNDVKRTMIESSIHAMEMMPKQDRHVSMSLEGISQKTYEKMCENVDKFRQEFLRLAKEDNVKEEKDRVVALNIQMFPVAKSNPMKNGGEGK